MSNQEKRFGLGRTLIFSFVLILLIGACVEFSSYIFLKLTSNNKYQPTHASKLPEHQFHPFLGWLSTPNLSVNTDSPCGPEKARINTDGNGYSIVPISFTNPDLTIAITGGSTIFGVGQDDNSNTVPSHLADIIHKRLGLKVNVINLGQRGYRSFQEMNILNDWFAHGHHADIVLAISSANDAIMGFAEPSIDNILVNRSIWFGAVKLARQAESANLNQPIFKLNLNWEKLADKSYFFNLINQIRQKFNTSNGAQQTSEHPIPYENIPARTTTAIGHYSAMAAITKSHGGHFIYMLQPTFFTKRTPTIDESSCAQKSLASAGGMNNQYGLYEVRFYSALHHSKKNFDYIDLRQSLNNMNTSSYIDNVHYNTDASHKLAEIIYGKIKPEILERIKHSNSKNITS